MMRSVPALVCLIPLEHREISDPQEPVPALVKREMPVCVLARKLNPKLPGGHENSVIRARCRFFHLRGSRYQDEEVASRSFGHLAELCHRLRKRLLEALDVVNEARFLALAEEWPVIVALLARELAHSGNSNCHNGQLRIKLQVLQLLRGKCFANIGESGQAKVRLVDAVLPNGIVIAHAREGRFQIVPRDFECSLQKAFHHLEYAVCLRKGHLQIDLGELRLAISAKIFIAEAAHDLKILVEAGDHQYLLEELR